MSLLKDNILKIVLTNQKDGNINVYSFICIKSFANYLSSLNAQKISLGHIYYNYNNKYNNKTTSSGVYLYNDNNELISHFLLNIEMKEWNHDIESDIIFEFPKMILMELDILKRDKNIDYFIS